MPFPYLNGLNDAQREAATFGVSPQSTESGPLLIIAGAGSGKTNTLASRVAHLIHCGVDPRAILLLTFTRRAAEEMIRRAAGMLAKAGAPCAGIAWSGTFHSMANRLLRLYAGAIGIDPAFTVLDRSDSADLMNKIRHELGFAKKERRFPKKDACFDIYSQVINAQCAIETALEKHFPWCAKWQVELKSLFKRYAETKRAMNVMDYDDLLLYWYHAVAEPTIARSMSKRFAHILVDEYQDTNRLQAGILTNIKPDGQGVTVVGDDAQSIYSFRAATVRNILDFGKQFAGGVRSIALEKNYRSTMPILHASNALMDQAAFRFTKNLFSDRHSFEKPFLVTAEDETLQAEYVATKVLEHREAGINLRDQAVLFRSSHHSAPLEIELGRRNIPFVKYGGLKFLEAAHIKDVIAVLRWAENSRDSIAAFRVVQLIEGIGPTHAGRILEHLEKSGSSFCALCDCPVPLAAREGWPGLYGLLTNLAKKETPWTGQVEQAREWYKPHFDRIYDANPSRGKDLEQLAVMAGKFPDREKFLSDLALNPPEVTSDESDDPVLDEDYLILSTIHSAKGQEWKAVFIINAADGWIPSDMATQDEEQVEEERRLLYVAMTRAKDHLHICYPSRFYKYGFSHDRADRNMYSIRTRFISDAMLDLFTREVYGRERSDDAPGDCAALEKVNVAEKVAWFWE
jgi:DNA helicase-2/ATP-dependent DNA helicase PcrA